FLNRVGAKRFGFHAFEHAGVPRIMKTIVNLSTIFTRRARSERRRARKRNEANIFERLRNKKMEMPPFYRDGENRNFLGADAERFCDALRNGRKRNFLLAGFLRVNGDCKTLKL